MKRKILSLLARDGFGRRNRVGAIGSGSSTIPPTTSTRCSATTSFSSNCRIAEELRQNHQPTNLALQMAKYIQNMPARYQALFSQWRNGDSARTRSETPDRGSTASTPACFRSTPATSRPPRSCHPTTRRARRNEPGRTGTRAIAIRLGRARRRRQLNRHGHHRRHSQQRRPTSRRRSAISNRIRSRAIANLNTEVSVLNKINAADVLTLRTLQDSNKLLASLLEQQTILAKQQREPTANAINADIARRRQPRRQHGSSHRHHHRFPSKLPHAVSVRSKRPGAEGADGSADRLICSSSFRPSTTC